MKWETPAFVEINMSAELGGYGGDYYDRDILGPQPAEPPKGNGMGAPAQRQQRSASDEQR